MCRVVQVGGREGAWWLPAGGIRASQGTFSSSICFSLRELNIIICLHTVHSRLKV